MTKTVIGKEVTRRNEPLGMPRGSVRAMITILVVISFVVLSALSVWKGVEMPKEIMAIMTMIIGFYFGVRKDR